MLEEKLKKHTYVKIVTNLPADLSLLDDSDMTQEDMVSILRVLKSEKVILITESYNKLDIFPLIDAGVCSIIPKSKQFLDSSLEIIERIQHKEFFLPSEVLKDIIEKVIQLKRVEYDQLCNKIQREWDLTLKQAEVASLMKLGHTNKEIANILGMSEGSVKVHVSQIYSKLKVNERYIVMEKLIELC
ncbi:LuxR C-terminal-related transcriptional regulator [Paucisalibacillus sp. EB02]|uniref:LuxR C-terminal-related transcriptional regulator n=1 Tax=Paucisalibacillus sp. EB02 TaxID=1347087 RepID=UPI0005A8407C|nr:LuxR C-terminal-related transcriptional regulator [Paucisalibacillus sp. EB02]